MVYSMKKILRNPYEPIKRRQEAQNGKEEGRNSSAPAINVGKMGPSSLVDVATKAANVLRSVQCNDDVSETAALGSNIMYWQRLPSQNFSFESAEILTVQECMANEAIYRNKTVRTTGLFVQRDLANKKGRVLLRIRHPIQSKPVKSHVHVSRNPRLQVTTPRSKMTSKPCLLHCKRKRPWVGGKLSSKGSPLFQQTIRQDNRNELMLTVEVDPAMPGLNDLVAGSSMIMAIGRLREDRTMVARIVRILEHFDAARHFTCLNARRRMMYKKHLKHVGQASLSVHKDKRISLLHGCGPPPYGSLFY